MKNQLIYIFWTIITLTIMSCSEVQNDIQNKDEVVFTVDSTRLNKINTYKNRIDSLNLTLEWRELPCGLFLSNNNMLALKSQQANSELIFIDRYITKCGNKDLITLIDTASFKYIGSSFYKDINNVYTHYETSDGGNFTIVKDADVKTFRILDGNHYAKDKNHIYDERKMILDNVDYETFKGFSDIGLFGKDKNGYYQWGEHFNIDSLSDLPAEIKEKLINL